jgi:hypothetical protein
LSEQFSNHQEQFRFSPPEDGTGFAGPAIKEIRKESPGPELLVGYIYFFGARNLRIVNIKVKVVGPGPLWCLATCRPGLNQFKDQGNYCVSSGLAWMRSGIKGISFVNVSFNPHFWHERPLSLSGFDPITPAFIKGAYKRVPKQHERGWENIHVLAPHIATFFKLLIKVNVPRSWKEAKLTPIHKKGQVTPQITSHDP